MNRQSSTNPLINAYVKERDKALLGTLEQFKQWASQQSFTVPPTTVLEISYHQMRNACVTLPMRERSKSKRWLIEHNYRTWDDGDVGTEQEA